MPGGIQIDTLGGTVHRVVLDAAWGTLSGSHVVPYREPVGCSVAEFDRITSLNGRLGSYSRRHDVGSLGGNEWNQNTVGRLAGIPLSLVQAKVQRILKERDFDVD